MPRKDEKMSGNLIQDLLPTYGVEAVELSKREIKRLSQELLNEE